jgi:hypothetical protein
MAGGEVVEEVADRLDAEALQSLLGVCCDAAIHRYRVVETDRTLFLHASMIREEEGGVTAGFGYH